MQQQAIPINPALLQWARMEAGLSLQEVAECAKVTSPRQKKGEELNEVNPVCNLKGKML